MKLLLKLPLEITNIDENNFHYFLLEDSSNSDYIEFNTNEETILNAFEASLSFKSGVFLIKNIEAFADEVDSRFLKKHFYVSENSWIFLSRSLKNKIQQLNLSELNSFNQSILEKSIKNLFSE